MFSKFLSLHNCTGHVFILSWKEQFFPYFYSLFYIVDLLYSTHILLLATSSERKRWKRVCRNQTNEMEQKKKKRLREGKAATTVAWHTIRIRPISCTWSEFLSNSSKGAPEPEKNQTRVGSFPKPLIHVPIRVWVYMYMCVSCASLYVCEESTIRISNSYHIKYNHRIIRRFINFNPFRPYFYQMQAFC